MSCFQTKHVSLIIIHRSEHIHSQNKDDIFSPEDLDSIKSDLICVLLSWIKYRGAVLMKRTELNLTLHHYNTETRWFIFFNTGFPNERHKLYIYSTIFTFRRLGTTCSLELLELSGLDSLSGLDDFSVPMPELSVCKTSQKRSARAR